MRLRQNIFLILSLCVFSLCNISQAQFDLSRSGNYDGASFEETTYGGSINHEVPPDESINEEEPFDEFGYDSTYDDETDLFFYTTARFTTGSELDLFLWMPDRETDDRSTTAMLEDEMVEVVVEMSFREYFWQGEPTTSTIIFSDNTTQTAWIDFWDEGFFDDYYPSAGHTKPFEFTVTNVIGFCGLVFLFFYVLLKTNRRFRYIQKGARGLWEFIIESLVWMKGHPYITLICLSSIPFPMGDGSWRSLLEILDGAGEKDAPVLTAFLRLPVILLIAFLLSRKRISTDSLRGILDVLVLPCFILAVVGFAVFWFCSFLFPQGEINDWPVVVFLLPLLVFLHLWALRAFTIPSTFISAIPMVFVFFIVLASLLMFGVLSPLLFLLIIAGLRFPQYRRLLYLWRPSKLPRLKMRGRGSSGFTLIELLIAIAIIVIFVSCFAGAVAYQRGGVDRTQAKRDALSLAEDQIAWFRANEIVPELGSQSLSAEMAEHHTVPPASRVEVRQGPGPNLREVIVTVPVLVSGCQVAPFSLAVILSVPAGKETVQ